MSFEIKRGEVVGIIGRNGAGKSTLLKILSRITEPTRGRIEIDGRVASLLEVGTGFHPELSGRENIFLNGAILGMSRVEIKRKFDEIVAFAEIERFLDTPVKRYSSGMYMRLAFAVAAHLEPEILIVDEVLAVGDAAFQKKCLGKMGEVAKGGRTVLFVSHNMQAVSQLTNQVIVLANGQVVFEGETAKGVSLYTAQSFQNTIQGQDYVASPGKKGDFLKTARIFTSESFGEHIHGKPITLEFDICISEQREGVCFSTKIVDEATRFVSHAWIFDRPFDFAHGPGIYRIRCTFPRLRLFMGRYTLTTYLSDRRGGEHLETVSDICPFEVTMRGIAREQYDWEAGDAVYLDDFIWDKPVRLEIG